MTRLEEVNALLEHHSGVYPNHSNTDIFGEMGIIGDDFHEVIETYAKKYKVDMSGYLWYFHADEEGSGGIGAAFFKPPYDRIKRIPVTPSMLADFSETKQWKINYPPHKIPKRRIDLIINAMLLIALLISFVVWFIYKMID